MTIQSLLAQSDLIADGLNDIYIQYGAIAFFAFFGIILILRIWRNSENAKIAAQNANTQRQIEDVKRDSLISGLAERSTKLEEQLRSSEIANAKLEGALNLLNSQFQTERDRNQEKQNELKQEIERLSKELNNHREELNGKTAIIEALELERDTLQAALKDKEAQIARINANLDSLMKDKERLDKVVLEQSNQIIALTKQIVELEDKLNSVANAAPQSETTNEKKEEKAE